MGGLEHVTPVQMTDVRRAAELVVLAEETRATALREGAAAIDISALVRLEGQAARAVKALAIKPRGERPKPLSIAEWLAAQAPRPTETAAE